MQPCALRFEGGKQLGPLLQPKNWVNTVTSHKPTNTLTLSFKALNLAQYQTIGSPEGSYGNINHAAFRSTVRAILSNCSKGTKGRVTWIKPVLLGKNKTLSLKVTAHSDPGSVPRFPAGGLTPTSGQQAFMWDVIADSSAFFCPLILIDPKSSSTDMSEMPCFKKRHGRLWVPYSQQCIVNVMKSIDIGHGYYFSNDTVGIRPSGTRKQAEEKLAPVFNCDSGTASRSGLNSC